MSSDITNEKKQEPAASAGNEAGPQDAAAVGSTDNGSDDGSAGNSSDGGSAGKSSDGGSAGNSNTTGGSPTLQWLRGVLRPFGLLRENLKSLVAFENSFRILSFWCCSLF